MRLEVTRKTDLAISALVELAAAQERLKTAQLAERLQAAPTFLAQVLTEMVRQGWVESHPGPAGGYCMAVEASALPIIDVIEAIEGPTETSRCVMAAATCGTDGYCPLHDAWTEARGVLIERLGSTTIAGILRRPGLDPDRPLALQDDEMKEA